MRLLMIVEITLFGSLTGTWVTTGYRWLLAVALFFLVAWVCSLSYEFACLIGHALDEFDEGPCTDPRPSDDSR